MNLIGKFNHPPIRIIQGPSSREILEDSQEICLRELFGKGRKVGRGRGIGTEVCFVGEKVSFLRLKTLGYRKMRGYGNLLTYRFF
jgi:hypothetical protein